MSPSARLFLTVALAAALAISGGARAEIYKFVDDHGHVTYTNMPRPGAKAIILDTPKPSPEAGEGKSSRKRGAKSQPSPSSFPKVDAGTQRKRDDMRRQLLEEEMASEQRNLNAARGAYSAGRGQPGADLNRLMDSVRLHEKNIEMLNKELSHIR